MKFWGEVFAPIFCVRVVLGIISTVPIAWGVSFGVADYVSDHAFRGLDTAVSNLQSSLNTWTGKVDETSARIQSYAEGQAVLDERLANLIEKVDTNNRQLSSLTDSINGLNTTITSINVRLVATDSRQRAFEAFVYKAILRQTKSLSPNPLWYKEWGLNELPEGVSADFLYPTPDDVRQVIMTYAKKK